MLKTLLILAATMDWSCHQVATFAGNVAIDRDNGVTQVARIQRNERALLVGLGSVDVQELKLLNELTHEIYNSRLSPRTIRDTVFNRCMGRAAGRAA